MTATRKRVCEKEINPQHRPNVHDKTKQFSELHRIEKAVAVIINKVSEKQDSSLILIRQTFNR